MCIQGDVFPRKPARPRRPQPSRPSCRCSFVPRRPPEERKKVKLVQAAAGLQETERSTHLHTNSYCIGTPHNALSSSSMALPSQCSCALPSRRSCCRDAPCHAAARLPVATSATPRCSMLRHHPPWPQYSVTTPRRSFASHQISGATPRHPPALRCLGSE
ncbi:hypothetical protein BDA96_01G508300 [Sorghum bicolor]|uniref:Uncharacterized protein n=1 Tax=Sorghum bicolor TaxID=4558 RepID=A0A921S6R3_SORBI|nr:hypothetical protein BDA96_01G508300 [Sorghum bicolor]